MSSIKRDKILTQNIDEILSRTTTNNAEFLYNISHEMRTPLNGIIGVVDLMSHESINSKQTFEIYLTTLEQSCRSLLAVVNRLQDISNLQTTVDKDIVCERKNNLTFDLQPVITGVSQNMQFFNDESHETTQLHVNYDKRIPRLIKADLTKIEQILSNLCTIGALISTDRYVTIDIDVKYLDKMQCTLKFSIKSGSISVKENFELKEIYSLEFENSDLFDSTSFKNMLIGINICRKFLQELNSDLLIHRVGDKLYFDFCLDVEVEQSAEKCEVLSHDMFNKIHVLVAEDNHINVVIVTKMLKILGVKYSVAIDGEEVVKMINKGIDDYDMIFMDLDMPIMSGYEATWHIREILNSDIKIIALTANSTNESKRRCRDAGMNDFFTKPITIQTLKEMVSKWYDTKSK